MRPSSSNNGIGNVAIPDVSVTNWKAHESGALRGFFTLTIEPGVVIHDCKLFAKGSDQWVKWPDRKYKKNDGTEGYAPIVEFGSTAVAQAFQNAVLAALHRGSAGGAHA